MRHRWLPGPGIARRSASLVSSPAPGKLALLAGGRGAVLDVMAQVGVKAPGGKPGLGEDRPTPHHAEHATGLEVPGHRDPAGCFTCWGDGPDAAGGGDERRQPGRLVAQGAALFVIAGE